MASTIIQIAKFFIEYPPTQSVNRTAVVFHEDELSESGVISLLEDYTELSTSSIIWASYGTSIYSGVVGNTSFTDVTITNLKSYIQNALAALNNGYIYLITYNYDTITGGGSLTTFQQVRYTGGAAVITAITGKFWDAKFLNLPVWAWLVIAAVALIVFLALIGLLTHALQSN